MAAAAALRSLARRSLSPAFNRSRAARLRRLPDRLSSYRSFILSPRSPNPNALMPPHPVIDAHGCTNRKGEPWGLCLPIFPPLYCRTERAILASRRNPQPPQVRHLFPRPLMQIFIVCSCCLFFPGSFLLLASVHPPLPPLLAKRASLFRNSGHVHAKFYTKTATASKGEEPELTLGYGVGIHIRAARPRSFCLASPSPSS